MSDQSGRSLISYRYLAPRVLKARSTEMQDVLFLQILFYYSFNQYITYFNILKINENHTFLYSISTIRTQFLVVHLFPQSIYFAMTGWYWNVYVIFICILIPNCLYWIWQVIHQHEACIMYFHIQYCAITYISHCYHSNHKMVNFKKVVLNV